MSGLLISLHFLSPIAYANVDTCKTINISETLESGIAYEQWADDVFFGKEVENNPLFFKRRKIQSAYRKAAEQYQLACDCDSAIACHNLGGQYKYGKGVNTDYEQAAVYFQRACDGGEPYGCSNLGYLYFVGRGFEHNEERAKELFDKACNDGLEAACNWE